MKTRMQKYYDNSGQNLNLREQKNSKIYENLDEYAVENYDLNTNEMVIDSNAQNIDVEAIKKILDTKYNKEPKRRSIMLEDNNEEEVNISLDETREYDINAILEKAKSEKEVDYEKERLKKLRDTQYNILNSLDIDEKGEEETSTVEETEETKTDELAKLINTITMRELDNQAKEVDPLDILTDLKGDDDTIVAGAKKEEESVSETSPIMSVSDALKIKAEEQEAEPTQPIEKPTPEVSENTFQFTQSDFDDFADLKKEVKSSKALIYIIVILVALIIIVGLVIFLNNFLDIGLF